MGSRGDNLNAVERLMAEANGLPALLRDPSEWQSRYPSLPFTITFGGLECPCYLTGFSNGVRYALCDVGTAGAASLRRILKVNFWRKKESFVTHESGLRIPSIDTVKGYDGLLHSINIELGKVRDRLLGIRPGRGLARKPSRRGRPRDLKITQALHLLKEGLRRHRQLKPRERWEHVFETEVLPRCVDGWPSMLDHMRREHRRKLRQALRARGGVGIPPARNEIE